MGLVISYCLALMLAIIFQCRPISAGWNFFDKGRCISLINVNLAIGAFNIVTDFVIVVVPLPLVLKLQLRPAKMIGLLAILATGFL